jgi:GH18 family chitinase
MLVSGLPVAVAAGTDSNKPANWVSPVEKHGKLQVIGTKLCDEAGNSVQLKGMSSSDFAEWNWGVYTEGSFDALAYDWEMDVIRFPAYSSTNNVNLTAAQREKYWWAVDAAIERGMYVICPWFVMSPGNPNDPFYSGADTFFNELKTRYPNVPNIIYEICNEPSGVSWAEVKSYAQSKISLIRSGNAAKDNLILVGTPQWDSEPQQAIASPLAGVSNVMYTVHAYPTSDGSRTIADLKSRVESCLANGLPIFCTEFGGAEGDSYKLGNSIEWIDFCNSKNIGWIGHAIYRCGNPLAAFNYNTCEWDGSKVVETVENTPLPPDSLNDHGVPYWPESQLTYAGNLYRARIKGIPYTPPAWTLDEPLKYGQIRDFPYRFEQSDNTEGWRIHGVSFYQKLTQAKVESNALKLNYGWSMETIAEQWEAGDGDRMPYLWNGEDGESWHTPINGRSHLYFDFYVDANKTQTGGIELLPILIKGSNLETFWLDSINLRLTEGTLTADGKFKKYSICVPMTSNGLNINQTGERDVVITMAVFGDQTDYKGGLYFDNIGFTNGEAISDPYYTRPNTSAIIASAKENGSVYGAGTYTNGAQITLTATANSGYTFDGWYENGSKILNAGASYPFTVTEARILETRFIEVSASSKKRTVAYVLGDWNQPLNDLPDPGIVDTILYQAATYNTDPQNPSLLKYWMPNKDYLSALVALKNQNPELEVLVSIGAAHWGENDPPSFNVMFTSPALRAQFIQECVNLMEGYHFDGFDFDFEMPLNAAERAGYAALVRETRAALGGDKLLTVATSIGDDYLQWFDLQDMLLYVDWFNVMTYCYCQPGINAPPYQQNTPNGVHDNNLYPSPQHSSYSNAECVQRYINQYGVPRDKIMMGLRFDGLYAYDKNNSITYTYEQIKSMISSGEYIYRWDDAAQASYLEKDGKFDTTYLSPRAIKANADYVIEQNLGGIMYWQYFYDDAENTLAKAVWDSLNTTYTITATAATGGTVTGSGSYVSGANVTLTAAPNSGYTFEGWYENGSKISNAGASYPFTVTEARILEARFIPTPPERLLSAVFINFEKWTIPDPNKVDIIYYGCSWLAGVSQGNYKIDCLPEEIARIRQIVALKSQNTNLKVVVTIGGSETTMPWVTWETLDFSVLGMDVAKHQFFANTVKDFINANGLDGVDIDWEVPMPDEKELFTLLVKTLKETLGEDKLVSVDTGCTDWWFDRYDLTEMNKYVDHFNVMTYNLVDQLKYATYNFPGPTAEPGHDANLYMSDLATSGYSLDYAIDKHLEAGIPPSKLLFGVQFSGLNFEEPEDADYDIKRARTLQVQQMIASGNYDVMFDETAKASYLVNKSTGTFAVSYISERSVGEFANYVKEKGLGGIFAWENSEDNAPGQPLVTAIRDSLDSSIYTITATAATGGTVIGSGSYILGANVTLTAAPNSGYTFEGWYENGSKISNAGASYPFTVTEARILEARFKAIVPEFQISSISISGAQQAGNSISCTAVTTGGSEPKKWAFYVLRGGKVYYKEVYSGKNSFTYTPTEAGSYTVLAYCIDSYNNKVKNSVQFTAV